MSSRWIVGLLLLAACSPGSSPEDQDNLNSVHRLPIRLNTESPDYHAGDELGFLVSNSGLKNYSYNSCSRIIQRDSAGHWVTVAEPNRICTLEADLIDSHGVRNEGTELPANLAPGNYRLVIAFAPDSGNGSKIQITSNPFTIK